MRIRPFELIRRETRLKRANLAYRFGLRRATSLGEMLGEVRQAALHPRGWGSPERSWLGHLERARAGRRLRKEDRLARQVIPISAPRFDAPSTLVASRATPALREGTKRGATKSRRLLTWRTAGGLAALGGGSAAAGVIHERTRPRRRRRASKGGTS